MNNHSSSSSFGTYEVFRILVPGFYFTTLLMIFLQALLSNYIPPIPGFIFVVWFVFLMLMSGLSMYAQESPKRRRAFVQNQPSSYLQAKARVLSESDPLSDDEARRLYFYMLNNIVPGEFHEKIFYFGMIYHIMVQIRRTSLWFAVVALLTAAFQYANGLALYQVEPLLGYSLSLWVLYALNWRYNKADRKMQENYLDQIFWLEMNDDIVKDVLKKRRSYLKQLK